MLKHEGLMRHRTRSATFDSPPSLSIALISQRVFGRSLCKSRFSHKYVHLFSILVMMKDTLTGLCGNWLLQIDFINTFCEVSPYLLAESEDHFSSKFGKVTWPSLHHIRSLSKSHETNWLWKKGSYFTVRNIWTLNWTLENPQPWTLNYQRMTMHPIPYNSNPQTSNPEPDTLNPASCTLHLESWTRNLRPSTLNSNLSILNPRPLRVTHDPK